MNLGQTSLTTATDLGPESRRSEALLHPALLERVLESLGFAHFPEPTQQGLRAIYAAWCQRIPFDNVRKLIHVRAGNPGPLPGHSPTDFFEAWLRHGTGGTCWAGAGPLQSFLVSLGFNAMRGVGTMLVAPDLPPNHGTVLVRFEESPAPLLVDSSILHREPLALADADGPQVEHPAWGVRASRREGRWHVWWRPLHRTDGFECRLERFDASAEEFARFHAQTRPWSPFNYELTVRANRGQDVVGAAFGYAVSLLADGTIHRAPISHQERVRLLIEDIGMSEEIAHQLPQDVPTPPPPGSDTAQNSGSRSDGEQGSGE